MKKYILQHQLLGFFGLSYLITWLLLVPLVLSNYGYIKISPHWHVLGSFGPIVSAIIITKITYGNNGLEKYFKKFIKYNVGLSRFFIAVFSPFILFIVSLLLVYLLDMPSPKFQILFSKDYSFTWIIGSLLSSIAYGFGEEAGWRGFALPLLQKKRSAFMGSLILSVFWAIWHIPMFFYRFEFGLIQIIGFFIGLFAGSILLTSIFNSTGGSILMVSLWHMNWNIVNIVSLEVSEEIVSLMSTFVIIIAIIIIILYKPDNLSPDKKVVK